MFCTSCGKAIEAESAFCGKCGKAVSKEPDISSPEEQGEKLPIPTSTLENTEQLLTYFRDILHCESSLIGFENTIQENIQATAELCIPRSFSPPKEPAPITEGTHSYPIDAIWLLKVIVAIILCFTPLVLFALPFLLWQIWCGYKRFNEMQTRKAVILSQYKTYWLMYEEEMAQYQDRLKKEKRRMRDEAIHKQIYEEQLIRLEELVTHAEETRSTLYELNILHGSYKNFQAVASIYNYLSTGRTSSLVRSGSDPGAYNLYEEDVRIGKIINIVGLVGTQIVGAVNDMSKSMRTQNQAICDAIHRASEIQSAATAQVVAGINALNKTAEATKLHHEASNAHLKQISEFQRIQTDALRGFDVIAGHTVFDKSGRPVS